MWVMCVLSGLMNRIPWEEARMNRLIIAALLMVSMAGAAPAQEVVEPKSGVKFATKDGDTILLGAGVRTKTVLRVKVYAAGLYVADAAVAGPLKGKPGTPDLYKELVNGDFKKMIVMKFVRDVSTDQIRDAFHESLKGAGAVDQWINYFTGVKSGQEFVIAWVPGTGVETKVAGTDKPAINDKTLAAAIFGIWLGEKPIQEDLKKDLVSRGPEVLK